MTVAELIAELQKHPADAPVLHFMADTYGDDYETGIDHVMPETRELLTRVPDRTRRVRRERPVVVLY